MEYKFKVWVDGNYYYEDEEYEKEIDLSEEEYDTIRTLVKEYDNDLSRGLMPILEAGSSDLYQRFYRAIFPEVFLELFRRDDMFEPEPGDEDRSWDVDDFDYLIKTYGDNYCFDEAYICNIPAEMRPPKMHLSKGMSKEDILKYIRRWNTMRNDLYEDLQTTYWDERSSADRDVIIGLIEKRLIDIAEKEIEQNDEATLSKDDFNPFADIIPFTPYSIVKEIIDEFQKTNSNPCIK